MIRLFLSVYDEQSATRRREYQKCLELNRQNARIDQICILEEGAGNQLPDHRKSVSRPIAYRPNYRDYLDWIAELAADEDISIVANSDIYFDKQLRLFDWWDLPKQTVMALSRWDVMSDGSAVLFDRNDSQDVWVFKGPLREVRGDFPVGVPRCDNRFLYELKRAGYEVINPAFSIRAFHLHSGDRRDYQSENLDLFVEPPYAYVWPHNLWSLPRTLWHNLRHAEARIGWRLDRRRIARSLPLRAARKLFGLLRPAGEAAC